MDRITQSENRGKTTGTRMRRWDPLRLLRAVAGRGRRMKVGLALGSGGARGWAHIGVIEAMREAGIPIHCVAGTSMGALVGAALASGKIDALHQVALGLDWRSVIYHFLEIGLPGMGLVDGGRIVEFVKRHVMPVDIAGLPMPFAAVATDIRTGREVVLSAGSLIDAVRASMAIPGIFTPLVRDDAVLVDGALVNPLPVDVVRSMGADLVIAVDVTRDPAASSAHAQEKRRHALRGRRRLPPGAPTEAATGLLTRMNRALDRLEGSAVAAARQWLAGPGTLSLFEVYGASLRIMEKQITNTRLKLHPPDVLIQPSVHAISTMEFHKAREAIQAGYEAARPLMDELQSRRSMRTTRHGVV